MAQQGEKTNAIRMLEAAEIAFDVLRYEADEDFSALHAAELLGLDPDQVFKTIVLQGERTGYFVCVIPGSCEIDLKKAARAAGDKSCALLPLKDLEPLTGYLRGGCSPVGMKRRFPCFFDESALLFEKISLSAGKRGLQVFLKPRDALNVLGAQTADLTA